MGNIEIKSDGVLEAVELWEDIAEHTKKSSLVWIKAHVGNEGNELADNEAKMGALSSLTPENNMKPWCVIKAEVEEFISIQWEQRWIKLPKHDATKLFIQKPDKNKSDA